MRSPVRNVANPIAHGSADTATFGWTCGADSPITPDAHPCRALLPKRVYLTPDRLRRAHRRSSNAKAVVGLYGLRAFVKLSKGLGTYPHPRHFRRALVRTNPQDPLAEWQSHHTDRPPCLHLPSC